MPRRRTSRQDDERVREASGSRPASEADETATEPSPVDSILALQRTAGNNAVAGLLQRDDYDLQLPQLGDSLRGRSHLSLLDEGGLTLAPPNPIRLSPDQLLQPAPPPPGIDFSRTGGPRREPARPEGGPRAPQLPRGLALEADERSITLKIDLRDRPLATLPNYFGTLDILNDPSVSMTVDLEPELAIAAEASATLLTQHFRLHGREIARLALGATVDVDDEGVGGSGSARAAVPLGANTSLNFTLTVRPVTAADGAVGLQFSPVVGLRGRF